MDLLDLARVTPEDVERYRADGFGHPAGLGTRPAIGVVADAMFDRLDLFTEVSA